MVKHIILWKLREDLSEEQKAEIKLGIKEGLEGLSGKVPGLLDIKVQIDGRLDSSNADVMLDSTLESPEALRCYAKHPAHVAVADSKMPATTILDENPCCLNFPGIRGSLFQSVRFCCSLNEKMPLLMQNHILKS